MNPKQLALDIGLDDNAQFNNFHLTENTGHQFVVAELQQTDSVQMLYLYGAKGVGRSHLLQAYCHQSKEQAVYLPLQELKGFPAAQVLEGIGGSDVVVLDDIDAVVALPDWAEQIFYLYNRLLDKNAQLIVSAQSAPKQLTVALADLQSRLSAMLVYQLKNYSDQDKQRIIQTRALRRGLNINDKVVQYMLQHFSRDLQQQMALLNRLDKAAMQSKRKVTIDLVKLILTEQKPNNE